MSVFVLDKHKSPLMPCSEKRARLLLARRRAVVVRVYPFAIRLKDRIGGDVQPVRVKIDPGSKATGIAVVRENGQKQHVLALMELTHRGRQISKSLEQRRAFRRRRRNQLRYRAPRFLNRAKPKGWLALVLKQAKKPLKDAAAVNATRWALYQALKGTGLPVEVATGGRTKFNRGRLNIPKTHALDAACVGEVEAVSGWDTPTLSIKANGRGSYQRTRLTKYGFPRGYLMRQKQAQGFQTGDIVKAIVPKGKKEGTWLGRVAVRKTGNFNVQTINGAIQGIFYKHCTIMQRADGYGYRLQPTKLQEAGVRETKSC